MTRVLLKAEAIAEAEKLLEHLASFMDRHNALVPELTVKTPGGIEVRLTLRRAVALPNGGNL